MTPCIHHASECIAAFCGEAEHVDRSTSVNSTAAALTGVLKRFAE